MITWQVTLDATVRIVLWQLRRIVLGEFIDDLELGSKIAKKIGIEQKDVSQSDVSEKIGISRLGPDDLLQNVGPSMIIVTLLLLTMIAILVISLYVCSKCQCSERRRK